jgi:hypothetical protein
MTTVAVSTAIGARTLRYRLTAVLGVAAVAFVLVAATAIYAVAHGIAPTVGFISTTGAERLSLALGGTGLVFLLVGRRRRTMLRPAELLMVAVVTVFLVNDWSVVHSQLMRDLRLDLNAGATFFHGQQPYLTGLFGLAPTNLADLPFLYPPFTLPFFAILSQLPEPPVLVAWLAVSLGAAIVALHQLGVRAWAIAVLLLWPPFFEGLAVGNVAVLTFAVFALAPRVPAALPAMAVFKLQSAIPSVWLLRERRWGSLLVGLGAIAALVLLTLPLVGVSTWAAWVNGLLLFQQSQQHHHYLYALALAGYLPYLAYLGIAAVVIVVAMILGRGRAGLARLGIASIVASPSLYRHGFLVALPGLLGNDELFFWLALGVATSEVGWWLLAALAFVGSLRFATVARGAAPAAHPLGSNSTPWGAAP